LSASTESHRTECTPACQRVAVCSPPSEHTRMHQTSSEVTSSSLCAKRTGRVTITSGGSLRFPGEKVETSGESLVINGQAVSTAAHPRGRWQDDLSGADWRYAIRRCFSTPRHATRHRTYPLRFSSGQFFVMGDNRFDARDKPVLLAPFPSLSIIGKKL